VNTKYVRRCSKNTKRGWKLKVEEIKQINEEKYRHGEYTLEEKWMTKEKMKDKRKKIRTKRREKKKGTVRMFALRSRRPQYDSYCRSSTHHIQRQFDEPIKSISYSPPIQWILGALSPEVKWQGHEADHSRSSRRTRMVTLSLHPPPMSSRHSA
jgi:hypothetical protein